MQETNFRNWLLETEAPVTGPIDWLMRRTVKPVVKTAYNAGGTAVDAVHGAINNVATGADKRIRRAAEPTSYAQRFLKNRGNDTDWDAMANGGIPSRTDGDAEKSASFAQDQANFGFTTERNLMAYVSETKKQSKGLVDSTKKMFSGLMEELGMVGYQTLQSPDVVVIRPAQELSVALAKICRIIKEKGDAAEQSQDPEQMKAVLQEAQEALKETQQKGNALAEALKMLGYGVVMGHWVMALGTYLYFTGNLMSFEHWLNENTMGLGVAMLIGYKAFVNVVFYTLPIFKRKAKEEPDSLAGKIGSVITRAIDAITPHALRHNDSGPEQEPASSDFAAKSMRYDKFRQDFRAARAAGKRGDDLPQWEESYIPVPERRTYIPRMTRKRRRR